MPQRGLAMPVVGLGTWQAHDDDVRRAVRDALTLGYRFIDTAAIYANEEAIGDALHTWLSEGHSRSELLISTKLWVEDMHPSKVQQACDTSLRKLQLDYIDLYLIHWPIVYTISSDSERRSAAVVDHHTLHDIWREFEKLVNTGKVKHIGVSNFNQQQLEDLLQVVFIQPTVNQIERHPYLPQNDLVDFCTSHNITVCAYSPLGSTAHELDKFKLKLSSNLMDEPLLHQIAASHGTTPAQITLSWNIQRNSRICVIPKSTNIDRQRQNLITVTLTQDEMIAIDRELGSKNIRIFDSKVLFGTLLY